MGVFFYLFADFTLAIIGMTSEISVTRQESQLIQIRNRLLEAADDGLFAEKIHYFEEPGAYPPSCQGETGGMYQLRCFYVYFFR